MGDFPVSSLNLTAPIDFYIVDVFAQTRYAGNQLAVFNGAADLTTAQMQRIAQEMNFSETTFILGGDPTDGYAVRIFTPVAELPFAGHPTLGTAYVLQSQVIGQPIAGVTLNLKVGAIPVQLDYDTAQQLDRLWMRQMLPQFGPTFTATAIAPVLGIEPTEIDPRFPIQEVSTGVPFILVPLRSRSTLQRLKVDLGRYYNLINQTNAKAIFAFCPETTAPDRQFSVRMFGDALGIPEDPATGSANGCLAGYLVEHRYLDRDRIDVQVEQGEALGRPSVLYLRAERQPEGIAIVVGGQVILVARGQFV
jgi:trans-2,3-dihydro-3-hydroxyanthranilate isomerase